MIGLRAIVLASATLLLSASPSLGLFLPEVTSQEVSAPSDAPIFKELNLTEPLYQQELSTHKLGKRQFASGSQTPLWYTGRTDPWASFKSFNWNTWINWGWSDHTLGYVK